MEKVATYFLVKALKNGDLDALEKLYREYYSKLFAFSFKFNQSTMDSDDFVQQTFLKIWEKRKRLKEDVLLDKQIFVICKNLIINQLKKENKFKRDFDLKRVPSEISDDQLDEANNVRKLYLLLEKLPKKRKEIFILHKIDNLTYEEIAGYLHISKKTIANHIYLAMIFLKEEIKK